VILTRASMLMNWLHIRRECKVRRRLRVAGGTWNQRSSLWPP
jgi:hypothetical protein